MTSLRLSAAQMARVTYPCGNPPPLERTGKRTVRAERRRAISPARSVAPVNCVTEITRAGNAALLAHVRWVRAEPSKERKAARARDAWCFDISCDNRTPLPGTLSPETRTATSSSDCVSVNGKPLRPSYPWRNRGDVSVNCAAAAIKIKPTAWVESPELFLNTAQLGLSVE